MVETDEVLVARATRGDAAAVDALVTRHVDAVYRVALRATGDVALAEDVAQDAWLRALRGLASFRGEAQFRTWLLRIALNTARDALRRRGRRREAPLEAAGQCGDPAPDPAGRVVLRTEAARLEEAIARLPEKQRLTVGLRIQEDLSFREIGALIDCSEVSARVNYHHGIKRLKEELQ